MSLKKKKKAPQNRVAHKKKTIKANVQKPILAIEDYGTDKDPCFGKLHSPTADECKICGDCEICSIISAQALHVKRKLIEKKTEFKDAESLPLDRDTQIGLVKYMDKLIAKGYIKAKVRRLCLKKYPDLSIPEQDKLNRLLKKNYAKR